MEQRAHFALKLVELSGLKIGGEYEVSYTVEGGSTTAMPDSVICGGSSTKLGWATEFSCILAYRRHDAGDAPQEEEDESKYLPTMLTLNVHKIEIGAWGEQRLPAAQFSVNVALHMKSGPPINATSNKLLGRGGLSEILTLKDNSGVSVKFAIAGEVKGDASEGPSPIPREDLVVQNGTAGPAYHDDPEDSVLPRHSSEAHNHDDGGKEEETDTDERDHLRSTCEFLRDENEVLHAELRRLGQTPAAVSSGNVEVMGPNAELLNYVTKQDVIRFRKYTESLFTGEPASKRRALVADMQNEIRGLTERADLYQSLLRQLREEADRVHYCCAEHLAKHGDAPDHDD